MRDDFRGEPLRWTAPETVHLTLRFLGQADSTRLGRVREAARHSARRWAAFDLAVSGLGCFPDTRRPRIVWAGAEDGSGALARIAADLESAAREAGFDPESRPFTPHLTLARVKGSLSTPAAKALAARVGEGSQLTFGRVPVRRIELMSSQRRQDGPRYASLEHFPLGEADVR